MKQADFWTEYSLNMPLPFGMLDLFYFSFFTLLKLNELSKQAKKIIFFLTNRCHFTSFQNFGKRISRTKVNTILIKTELRFIFQSTWDAKIMVTFWLQLSDKVTFESDYIAKMFFELFM